MSNPSPAAPTRFAAARKTETNGQFYRDRARKHQEHVFAIVAKACDAFFLNRQLKQTPWNEYGSTRKSIIATETEDETASSDPALAFRIEAMRDKSAIC